MTGWSVGPAKVRARRHHGARRAMRPPAPCLSASCRAFSTCRPSCARPRHSVATAATSQPTTSPGELAAARRVLTQSIEAAAQREDYSSAAQLKRELEELNKRDPAWQLNQQLQECVREERFQVRCRVDFEGLAWGLAPQGATPAEVPLFAGGCKDQAAAQGA